MIWKFFNQLALEHIEVGVALPPLQCFGGTFGHEALTHSHWHSGTESVDGSRVVVNDASVIKPEDVEVLVNLLCVTAFAMVRLPTGLSVAFLHSLML